jgi:L-lactate dehydrogenase (cytochrome)
MPEVITCIEDLRVLAKRRVPKMFYDYADSGSWTEGTYRANETDFQKILLRQRVAVDMSNRTLATTLVGQPVSMPVALAPVGMTGMQHPDGEILAARAANAAGIPFTLSTMSICSIEDVAENTDKPFWVSALRHARQGFHRSPDRPRPGRRLLGARADPRSANPGAASQGPKERPVGAAQDDARQHRRHCHQATLVTGMLGTKRRSFRNIVGHAKGCGGPERARSWTAEQFDPTLNWDDVKRIKDRWGGKLILKGIMDPRMRSSPRAAAPMR